VSTPDYQGCRPKFEQLFREYRLPRFILSDNGPAVRLTAGGSLESLVGLVDQARHHAGADRPGQAAAERPPWTDAQDSQGGTTRLPAASLKAQQRRFDRFRAEFNHERPHEALGQTVPASFYQPSARAYLA
jgi:putative transposase